MAEGAALEMPCTGNCTVGSNPTLSVFFHPVSVLPFSQLSCSSISPAFTLLRLMQTYSDFADLHDAGFLLLDVQGTSSRRSPT